MNVLCITDHELLQEGYLADRAYRIWKKPYLAAIDAMALTGPKAIILREKFLSGIDYTDLYSGLKKRMMGSSTMLIWHDHYQALRLFIKYHPRSEWPDSLFLSKKEAGVLSITDMREIEIKYGVSVHDVNELLDAKRDDTPYIMATNIFKASSKPGEKPKGLGFLKDVCDEFSGPVYAIGGVNPQNARSCIEAGAEGVAVKTICMKQDLAELKELIAM